LGAIGSILDLSDKKQNSDEESGFLKHHVEKVSTKTMRITERAEKKFK